jgi:hypothetical protein
MSQRVQKTVTILPTAAFICRCKNQTTWPGCGNTRSSQDAPELRVGQLRVKKKRGVVVPAAVLTAAIAANPVQATPAALARTVTAAAIAKGAASNESILPLIKGALKIMAWTKPKMTIFVMAGMLLATGAAIMIIPPAAGTCRRQPAGNIQ